MKKSISLSALFVFVTAFSGCAMQSDIDALTAEIERLKAQSTANASSSEEALAVGATALQASESAQEKAIKAEIAAVEAAARADESNNKLDRMFKHSMMK